MARLYVVSGPSGVGKSTIAHAILDKFKDSMIYSISMTTRPIRYGESDGREYKFTTVEEFEKLIEQNAFIEHAKVHDNYYGTLKAQIENALAGGINVLLDIDTKGAQNIKNNYHDAVLIFIAPPSIEELKQRLFKRHTDADEVIEKRIHNAIKEIEMSSKYDYIVKNIDLEQAVGECEQIIEDNMNKGVIPILKILLCVSSSIAAYKSLDLVSKLKQAGHEIIVAMTGNAQKIVSKVPFKSLSRNEVITDLFADEAVIAHIALTDWCDILVAAPASYNLISKIACGIADDAVTTIAAACKKNVLIAPAMNANMYENPIFIENLNKLRKLENYNIIEPAEGYLACGTKGRGRMASVEDIIARIEAITKSSAPGENIDLNGSLSEKSRHPLYDKNIIITAGPTREYIDSVRFMSNPSTGRMGYALAQAALAAGAHVTLISGPVSIGAPDGILKKIDVVTTKEMLDAVIDNFGGAHILISAAAPCDFTFNRRLSVKAAKIDIINDGGLKLIATEDILKAAAKIKKNQIVVGFAAEDNNHLANAVKKMKAKSMDMIVLNDVSSTETGFASDFNKITIIKKGLEKSPAEFEKATKTECARIILDNIASLMAGNKRQNK